MTSFQFFYFTGLFFLILGKLEKNKQMANIYKVAAPASMALGILFSILETLLLVLSHE